MGGFGRSVFACFSFSGVTLATGAASGALADDWLRLPSLTYASEAELGPIDRTGFILSPDLSINDQVKLGGSGGALLEDPSGFALGARAGYDYQAGNVLLGVITDGYYSFTDGGGSGVGAGVFKSELHYYGTVRGRLGVGIGRFLPYATAGYAYGELKVSNNVTGVSSSETLSGWTYAGAWSLSGTAILQSTAATTVSISTTGHSRRFRPGRTRCRRRSTSSTSAGSDASRAHGHFTTGGIEERIESTLPPVLSPNTVPLS